MTNQNNKFEELIKHASSALMLSKQRLDDKYKDCSVCTIEHTENGEYDHHIEIRFDKNSVTLSLTLDRKKICDRTYLFFDHVDDEDLFIDHLIETVDYSFRKSHWILGDCYLKVRELGQVTSFCFYRL